MRALVVDDSRAARAILGRILRELGCEVVEAEDGQAGIRRLADGLEPDFALVDWNMPEMNGVEFVRRVRADPARAGLRLLMVTTEIDQAHVEQALAAGANEYIMKPFTADVIQEKLRILGLADR